MPHDPHVNEAFLLPGNHPGLVQGGNLNLFTRPKVKNPDGGISTVDSTSFNIGGHEVLIPLVVGNKILTPNRALAHFLKTGEHLGVFKNPASADRYAELLHQQQEAYYLK